MGKSKYHTITKVFVVMLLLSSCKTTGSEHRADVYKSSQVNKQQEVKTVKLIAIMPAKVEVDNSEAVKKAQVGLGLLGSLAGGILGASSHEATTGVILGGAAGVAGGTMVSEKVLVEGVSLTYTYNGKTYNSAQVGQKCEYTPGTAIMVSQKNKETRIQPNATCPKKR